MKRLVKSRTDRKLCGVCGGVGEYFNIDPTAVRIGMVVLACCGFAGVVIYIAAAIIMPEE